MEGENVVLECRFSPRIADHNPIFYWLRTNREGHDNVAFDHASVENDYTIEFNPEEGFYDLRIRNVTYDRDNGRFDCRTKKKETGEQLHSKAMELTVLLRPSKPRIIPSELTATEGKKLNLTCETLGGSPHPQIKWYQQGRQQELDSLRIEGKNKDEATKAILTLMPTRENDGSVFRCTVWNRAMAQNEKYETSTQIQVNYFPRVDVGPQKPLRVELDDTAQLTCKVDAKPKVTSVKWIRKGRFIDTHFTHTIPRVRLEDAGLYKCSADNGLGKEGVGELTLDVQYGPIITLPEKKEFKLGEQVVVECSVTANPSPVRVQWFKVGNERFSYVGKTLRLPRVTAEDNGQYICSATNYIDPAGKGRLERTKNATISINVRHAPGKAIISPDKPIAVDGRNMVLRCGANPPGFPEPTYTWWKESPNSKQVIAQGKMLEIESVNLRTAGKYYCKPSNILGDGTFGYTHLEVYQAPKIITPLQSSLTKRESDKGFHVTCGAVGKPRPRVRWFKDGHEIVESESKFFQVTEEVQTPRDKTSPTNVQSTLSFVGPDRIDGQQLMPSDRGSYICQFENEVNQIETNMLLRIEHAPVVVHQHNRVAFDLGDTAYIKCRMQSYPKPSFDWSYKNSLLNDPHFYDENTTYLGDDIYESTLKIFKVDRANYGDYTCKATNRHGPERTIIHLQKRGKPDKPKNIRPLFTSYDMITLGFDEGFNGGYNNTSFTVQFAEDFRQNTPKYEECHHKNPCNITGLKQHTQYFIRVKARNIMGESKYSDEVEVGTKVDVKMIPQPAKVHYEKSTKRASFHKKATDLRLVAKLELENSDGTWAHYKGFSMHDEEFAEVPIPEEQVRNLRVRLCLEDNELLCGQYKEAQIVDVRPRTAVESAGLGQPWLIGVVVALIILALIAFLLILKCFCCRKDKTKALKGETARPTIIHNAQPPPGYGETNVKEAKDVSDDSIKANLYSAAQTGFYPGEQQTNSNSNSANGGSVNSQDSLWNVKNNGNGVVDAGFHGYQNGYIPFDTMAMQQQQQQTQTPQQQQQFPPTNEDYAHYPYPDEYLRQQQYLGQQQQQQQPNGKLRGESDCKFFILISRKNHYTNKHLFLTDSHYGEMSGLPNPYDQQYQAQQYQQQQQFLVNADDSTTATTALGESGYSTPTSKNRRIIREIIV